VIARAMARMHELKRQEIEGGRASETTGSGKACVAGRVLMTWEVEVIPSVAFGVAASKRAGLCGWTALAAMGSGRGLCPLRSTGFRSTRQNLSDFLSETRTETSDDLYCAKGFRRSNCDGADYIAP
jgi:hypothetical protein